jgi:hypothetical protein
MKEALDRTGRIPVTAGQRGPNKRLVRIEGDGTLTIVRSSYQKYVDNPLAGNTITRKQFNMAFATNDGFFIDGKYYMVASRNQISRYNRGHRTPKPKAVAK